MELIGQLNRTGHQYYGTYMEAYESTDNCGTCDGARCDNCKDIYEVYDYDIEDTKKQRIYKGTNKEKAIKLAGCDFTK